MKGKGNVCDITLGWLQWLCVEVIYKIIISGIKTGFLERGLWTWNVLVLYIRNLAYKFWVWQIISLAFQFIVRNTNNYELQRTTTMHSNTVHTHMIEIITKQKKEMITSQYVVCLEASNIFYKLNSCYWILYKHSVPKIANCPLYWDDDCCVTKKRNEDKKS